VNGVLLRPLPFHDPAHLMMLDERWLPRFPRFEATPQDFLDWQAQSHAFEQMSAFVDAPFNITGQDHPERILGARVSANLTSVLGVKPIIGRTFTSGEDQAGHDNVALLSEHLWRRLFRGDPQILGTEIKLNNAAFTVIGVMPADFHFPEDVEIWKPMGFTKDDFENGHFVWCVARLKPGVTVEQAQAEMNLIMPRLAHPQVWSVNVVPLPRYYVGSVRIALFILLGAAGFVLLIACVNIANLLLARGSARQKEISLRISLGAMGSRIVQQLLTESLLLSVIGGLFGLFLASFCIGVIKNFSPVHIPRLDKVTLDTSVLLFTFALSLLAGLVFGLLPAISLSRADVYESVKTGGRSIGDMRAHVRSALVVSEVALSLVLLVGAGLLLKSFGRILQVHPGFNPESVLATSIDLPVTKYKEPYQQEQFVTRLLERLKESPEIRQAAVSTGLPFSDVEDAGIRIDGRVAGTPDAGAPANYYCVSPQYFQVMQIPLIRGRLFTERDALKSLPVVLINETMSKRFFSKEDPIGKRLDISAPSYLRQIVGVVGDVKQASLNGPKTPQVYEPFLQKPSPSFTTVVRGAGNPISLAGIVRRQVQAIDKDQPIAQIRTMDEVVNNSVAQDRFSVILLGTFALLALVLAAVGIYGVMAYSVTQRTQEIGVRIALGANRTNILGLILAQSLRVVLLGVGIGLVFSLFLTRVMTSLLYDVKAIDPAIFAGVAVMLMAVALVSALVPALRASSVDPIATLRQE